MSLPNAASTALIYDLWPSLVGWMRLAMRAARSAINTFAYSASRLPTIQQGTSLVSASMATHVYASPLPIECRSLAGVFFAFELQNDHISSTWTRLQLRLRIK